MHQDKSDSWSRDWASREVGAEEILIHLTVFISI